MKTIITLLTLSLLSLPSLGADAHLSCDLKIETYGPVVETSNTTFTSAVDTQTDPYYADRLAKVECTSNGFDSTVIVQYYYTWPAGTFHKYSRVEYYCQKTYVAQFTPDQIASKICDKVYTCRSSVANSGILDSKLFRTLNFEMNRLEKKYSCQ